MPGARTSRRFDADYYDRFYRRPRTKVASTRAVNRLGRFVAGYLGHLQIPVREVLDLGCGLGAWQRLAARWFPGATYVGVEVSEYVCAELGWTRGSVVDYRHPHTVDLVVCQGVLQYLGAADARRAIANLARLSHGALYLEVLTSEDWEHNCDRSITDGDVDLRPAAFYRRELRRTFVSCGGGVFVKKDAGAVLYELERGA